MMKKERAEARITAIDKIVTKLYTDNAMGKLDDDRLSRMVADLEKESAGLKVTLEELNAPGPAQQTAGSYAQFFALARSYTNLDELDRDTLVTFVERIEIGPKIYENGSHKVPARANQPYRQSVRIFYKFIGELTENSKKCSEKKPAQDGGGTPREVGVNLKEGYNSDLSSRDAGGPDGGGASGDGYIFVPAKDVIIRKSGKKQDAPSRRLQIKRKLLQQWRSFRFAVFMILRWPRRREGAPARS